MIQKAKKTYHKTYFKSSNWGFPKWEYLGGYTINGLLSLSRNSIPVIRGEGLEYFEESL